MNEHLTILIAADLAARWHCNQKRKGSAGEPYINHLLEVACLVAEAEPGDITLITAAVLHDAIEDQQIPKSRIAETFGDPVADLVEEVTDDKALPKAERKRLQVVNAGHKSRRAKLLKLADKTSNLRSLAASPPADWPLQRRREYVEWATSVAEHLVGISPVLDRHFDAARKTALDILK